MRKHDLGLTLCLKNVGHTFFFYRKQPLQTTANDFTVSNWSLTFLYMDEQGRVFISVLGIVHKAPNRTLGNKWFSIPKAI